nr:MULTISPECIES: hypothetical protein [unclassified Yoonia]
MTLADWVRDQSGRDPGADLRGTYGDPGVCAIARPLFRDPEPVVTAACARAGLTLTTDPQPGDVGVLRQTGNRFLVGGLCLGDNWASKTADNGVLIFRPLEIIKAWESGYAK